MKASVLAIAVGLALLSLPDAAEACSAAEPESALLVTPAFDDDTQVERATLDVSCAEEVCRFEAHYFLTRKTTDTTHAALALRNGRSLRAFAGRESPSRRIRGWRIVELPVESGEIRVEGTFPLVFGADPCVGPGYLARHRFLGTEGRPRTASFSVVAPDRSVPHVVRLRHPAGWGENAYTFDGPVAASSERDPSQRALRETTLVKQARDAGDLAETPWSPTDHDSSFRLLQVWFTRAPFPIQHAGPMLAAGYRFDVKRPWFRLGYEVAAPSWLITSAAVESDFRDHALVVPSLELTTGFGHGGGDRDTIFGLGAGLPIEVSGDSRLFGRVFVTASLTSFGLLGGVDYAPDTKDLSGNAMAALWF